MIYKTKTNVALKVVKANMDEKAKDFGFGVLKQYPFQSMLSEKGSPIKKDITVFELCNPPAAQAALNETPEISVYLPCRISVYEYNGKTVLATIALDSILRDFDLSNDLKQKMQDVFANLKSLMNYWE